MDKELKIKISVDKKTGVLKVIDGEFEELSRSIKKTDKSVDGFSKSLKGMVQAGASIYVLKQAFDAVMMSGFSFNKGMEDSVAGLTALTVATSANVSAMGKHLSITEKYALANKEATKTAQELAKINAQTPHTLNQTNQIYKAMYVSMKKAGASTQDMIGLTKKISIAAGAGGIEFNSLLAGVDGLATGTVLANSDLGRFLGGLGLTNEALKNSTDIVGLLNEKLNDFKAVNNMTTDVSNLQNEWEQLAGVLTKDIFDIVKDNIKDATGFLGNFRSELHDFMIQYKDVADIKNVADLKEKSVQLQIELLKLEENKPSKYSWNSEKKEWREKKEAFEKELELVKKKIEKQKESDALMSSSSKWLTKIAKQRDNDFAMVSDMWDAKDKRDEEALKNTLANTKTASDKQILLNEELNKELASKNPYDMLSAKAQEYIKEAKGNQKNLLLIGEWYNKAFSALEDKTHEESLKKAKETADKKASIYNKNIQDYLETLAEFDKYDPTYDDKPTTPKKDTTEQFKTDWGVIISNTFSDGMQDAFNGEFDLSKLASGLGTTVGNSLSSAGLGQATQGMTSALDLDTGIVGGLSTLGIGTAISASATLLNRGLERVSESSDRLDKSIQDLEDVNKKLVEASQGEGSKLADVLSLGTDLNSAVYAANKAQIDYKKSYNEEIDTVASEVIDGALIMFTAGLSEVFDFGDTILGWFGRSDTKQQDLQSAINESIIALQNQALAVIDSADAISSYGDKFKDMYDKISDSTYFSDIKGKKALSEANGLAGDNGYGGLEELVLALGTKYDITDIVQFKKDLAKSIDTKEFQDALSISTKLLDEFGVSAIDMADTISMAVDYQTQLNKVTDDSNARIKEWDLRGETERERVIRLANEVSSSWSTNSKIIDDIVNQMMKSGGVFTDEEKKAAFAMYDYSDSIAANKKATKDTQKAIKDAIKGQEYTQAQFVDSLNGTSTALDYAKEKVGMLGDKLPDTKDKLITLRQAFIDNDGTIDTYEQAVIDATLATKPFIKEVKKVGITAEETAKKLAEAQRQSRDAQLATMDYVWEAQQKAKNQAINAQNDLLNSQIKSYNTQKSELDKFLQSTTSSISSLESAFSSLSTVVADLRGITGGTEYTLQSYYKSMSSSLSLSHSNNYDAFKNELDKTINLSSVLKDTNAFSTSNDQKFAQLVAANQFDSMKSTALTQIDYLKMIESNTRAQISGIIDVVNALGGQITSIASSASNQPPSIAQREADYLDKYSQVADHYALAPKGSNVEKLKASGMTLLEYAKFNFEHYGKFQGREFAVGTPSVPRDMIAKVHQSEIIVPASFSDGLRNGDLQMGDQKSLIKEVQILTSRVEELIGINETQAQHIKKMDKRDNQIYIESQSA